MTPGAARRRAVEIWAALATVYVVWGATYPAIAVAIRTLPPLLMASIRFLVAGALLYAWSIRRGERERDRPGRRQWQAALVVGGTLLLVGNGGVAWAEQSVASGLVALVIATVPLWMALLDHVGFGQRLGRQAAFGLVLGLGGLVALMGPSRGEGVDPLGAAVAVAAALCWAAGSLYSRRAPLPSRPLLGAAMGMLAGGVLLGAVGIASGELEALELSRISAESVLALAYLVVFGSLVGFSAYIWLLRVARTSLVSTYAYANPVVAVLLGWAVLGEAITVRTLLAGSAIVVAVALIVSEAAATPSGAAEPAGPAGRGRRRRAPAATGSGS